MERSHNKNTNILKNHKSSLSIPVMSQLCYYFIYYTYSVNVVFAVVGVIVVNNELNIVNIQTTGSDICGDQDCCTSSSEDK